MSGRLLERISDYPPRSMAASLATHTRAARQTEFGVQTRFGCSLIPSHISRTYFHTVNDRLSQMLRFLEQDPNDSFARYAVALEYASRKQPEQAIATLVELRQRDPEYVALYYQLGGLYALAERLEDAEETYRTGITVAIGQNDRHTAAELEAALDELDALR